MRYPPSPRPWSVPRSAYISVTIEADPRSFIRLVRQLLVALDEVDEETLGNSDTSGLFSVIDDLRALLPAIPQETASD